MGQINYPSASVASYSTSTMMPTGASSVLLDGQLTLTSPYTGTFTGVGGTVTLVAVGGNGATFTLAGKTYTVPSGSKITTTSSSISGSQSVTIAAIKSNQYPAYFKPQTLPTLALAGSQNYTSSAFGNNTFVIMNNYSNDCAYSTDNGVTWASASVPSSNYNNSTYGYWDVEFGNGKFVAIGGYYSIVSTNGYTWTQGTISGATNWYSLAYGNGMWMAYGPQYLAQTTDGINWSTAYNANSYYAVQYRNQICYHANTGNFNLVSNGLYLSGPNIYSMSSLGDFASNPSYTGAGSQIIASGNGATVAVYFGQSSGGAGSNAQSTVYGLGDAPSITVSANIPINGLPINALTFVNGYFIASAWNTSYPSMNVAYSSNGKTWSGMGVSNNGGVNKVSFGNNTYVGSVGPNQSLILFRATTPTTFTPVAFGVYAGPKTIY